MSFSLFQETIVKTDLSPEEVNWAMTVINSMDQSGLKEAQKTKGMAPQFAKRIEERLSQQS